MRSASIATITFWMGPAGQSPVNVIRHPSYAIAFSPSWRQTMSGSATVTSPETRTSASR